MLSGENVKNVEKGGCISSQLNLNLQEDQRSPLDYFNLFIKDEDNQTIADETNHYADQFLQRN